MNKTTNTPMADNEISDCKCDPCHCRPVTVKPVRTISEVLGSVFVLLWIMGAVMAKGFWSTVFCIFPPYAWYLAVERAMHLLLGPAWL